MDKDLSIQEIKLLAGYKTNNPNISEQEAIRIINSVLPDYQNNVNSWGIQSSNASAFGNSIVVSGLTECDTAQVVCNNLFQKLGFVQPKTTETLPVQVPPSEPTAKDVKLFAVDYLQNDLDKALSIYNTQINNQGTISNIFNSGKELFNTEFASSRVGRILANEQLGAQLLELSANYQLSQKDYFEAKLDLAVKLLGADSKDAKYLQSELGKLEPQKLNEFISKILTLSDEDYAVQIPQIKENLTARALQDEQRANSPHFLDRFPILNIKLKNPNSVASLIENKNSSYKLMDFETTFLKERGVSYNPEAITDFATKQAYLSLVLAANNRNKQIQNLLYDATTAVDGNNKYGAPFQDATGACISNLERKIIQALTSLYGNDTEKINEVLKQNNASFKDGKIDCLNKSYTLVNISKNIQANLNSNIKSLLNGKNIAEYESECKQAYNLAYGEENGTRLAEAFVESQVKGVQAVKAGVQGVGMLVSIAGQVIPIGGQIASAMIWGGIALGTFGGATVQFAEDVTKAGGITVEDKKAILQELAMSSALMASGMGIGKMSSMVYAELVMQNCPRLAALVSKVGLDASLSVLADYAITGQVDLTSEGISQLIPILIGLTKAKGSMNAYLNTEMPNRLHLQNGVKNSNHAYFNSLSAAEQKIVLENNIAVDDVFNINAILRRKITEYDNDMVLEARFKNAKAGSLDINSLTKNQRNYIDTHFLRIMESKPREKSFIIVTGRGGSGKSTIIRELGIDKTHMLLDSDEIKPLLPGFNENGANYVHKASVQINEDLLLSALEDGTNIVFPTTGWHSYVEKLITMAHEAGYKVQLIHSNIDTDKSIQRALKRFMDGEQLPDGTLMHRFVDPAYIQDGAHVDAVVDKFKNHPYITEDVIIYDNNGSYPPKLVEKIKK